MVTNDARWPTAGAGVLVALALIGQGAIARQPAPVDLTKARAHWVDTDTILWDVSDPGLSVRLHVAPPGGYVASGAGLSDAPTITLAREPTGPSTTVREAFPHLARLAAFRIPADALTAAHAALTGHPFVWAASSDGSRHRDLDDLHDHAQNEIDYGPAARHCICHLVALS